MMLQVLPLLEQPFLQNKYAQALTIVIITIVAATIFTLLLKSVVRIFTKKTKTELDDMLVDKLKGPAWWFILFIGLHFAIIPLNLPTEYDGNITKSLIILIITVMVARTLDVLIDFFGQRITKRTKSSLDDELLPIIHRTSRILIYVMGILVIISSWGIEIGPMLASLGIAGIAIGFALKDSLANIFGGISLLMDKTFKKGDVIRLENGTMGMVHDIGLRSTRIKTWDNQIVTIPNGNLSVTQIENWKQPDLSIRITIDFGVEYGTKIEKVRKLVMDLIKKDKDIAKDPEPRVLFTEMADSALLFKARFFVEDIAIKLDTEDRMRTKIYDALNKAKIGIPFPQRTIHLKKR